MSTEYVTTERQQNFLSKVEDTRHERNIINGLAIDSWMCAISGRAKQFGMIEYFKDCQ